MFRVREVISKISKDELLRVIPSSFLDMIPDMRCEYPDFIYGHRYSIYGFYMELVTKSMLSQIVKIEHEKNPLDCEATLIRYRSSPLGGPLDCEATLIRNQSHLRCDNIKQDFAANSSSNIQSLWNRYIDNNISWEDKLYTIRDILNFDITDSQISYLHNYFRSLFSYYMQYFANSKHLTFHCNSEFSHKNISGHPDLDCINATIEVKNTNNPSKDKLNHLKQTLAYTALKRANNLNCNYILLIFPMQLQVVEINVSQWNAEPYLQLMLSKVSSVQQLSSLDDLFHINSTSTTGTYLSVGSNNSNSNFSMNNSNNSNNSNSNNSNFSMNNSNNSNNNLFSNNSVVDIDPTADINSNIAELLSNLFISALSNGNFAYQLEIGNYGVGTHIEKLPTLYQSLTRIVSILGTHIPFQIYLRNPRNGSGKMTDKDINDSRNYIIQNNLRIFVHCALCVNLANPFTKKNPNSDAWPIGIMIEDLNNCKLFGGKGLVIHCGSHLQRDIQYMLNKFENSVRRILAHATVSCPLILETCAGEGTDLCHQFDDLVNFYNRFSNEEKTKLKICVDTCHVFAAGYIPSQFIINWERIFPDSIRLVHFNDSKKEINCRVDRHEPYITDKPNIGPDLLEVAKYCHSKNISMVTE